MPILRTRAQQPNPVSPVVELPAQFPPIPQEIIDRFPDAESWQKRLNDFWTRTTQSLQEAQSQVSRQSNSQVIFSTDRFLIYANGGIPQPMFALDSTGVKLGDVLVINTPGRKVYIGAGNYQSDDTPFYIDTTGRFSLGANLTWDPETSTLTITGTIIATSGTIGGFTISTYTLSAGTGADTIILNSGGGGGGGRIEFGDTATTNWAQYASYGLELQWQTATSARLETGTTYQDGRLELYGGSQTGTIILNGASGSATFSNSAAAGSPVVAIGAGSAGSGKFSIFQSATERARFQYVDNGASTDYLEIQSDGTARIIAGSTQVAEFSAGTYGLSVFGDNSFAPEVRIKASASGGGVLSYYQTTTEVARIQFTDGGGGTDHLDIQSDGTIDFIIGSTTVGNFTSTGLNGAAIGATTPSTGAFTTLSATGAIVSTTTGNVLGNVVATTAAKYIAFTSTGNNGAYWGIDDSTGSIFGGAAYDMILFTGTGTGIAFTVNGSGVVGRFSSTGLVVTGDVQGDTYHVGATAGIDASVTTGALVGKTLTFVKGICTGFA